MSKPRKYPGGLLSHAPAGGLGPGPGPGPGGAWTRMGGTGYGRMRFVLPGARFDWEREAGDPWMNSVVALGLAWIGDRLPRPRFKVSKIGRGGKLVEDARHGLAELWTRPNPHYGRRTLEKAVGMSLKVDGNAYIYKVRDNGGRVCQLWWVPHFAIQPTWPSDGSAYVDGYMLRIDAGAFRIPIGDVVHIRDGIDPRNERFGLSALKSAGREICTVNYEASFTAAILKNSGVPAVVMVPADENEPGPASSEEAARMADRFVDMHSGDDAGRPLVSKGRYRIEKVGYSPEEMVLEKLPASAIARLAAAVGVSAMSVGLPDPNKTYSNLGEANRSSWGTIVALQELIAESIAADLLREPIQVDGRVTPAGATRDYAVSYDYTDVQELQESLDSLHKRTRDDFLADLITRGQAQDQLGYEADAVDGDLYCSQIKASASPAAPDEDGTQPDEDEPASKSWRY